MKHLGAGLDSSGKKIKKALCGGTLAATPISCVAGYVAISEIEKRNACRKAGEMGDRLVAGLKKSMKNITYRLLHITSVQYVIWILSEQCTLQ